MKPQQFPKYLSSFHQHIWERYNLNLLLQDGWASYCTPTTIGLVKYGTKTTLSLKAQFIQEQPHSLEQQTDMLFRAIILTPQQQIIPPAYEIRNPYKEQIYRILAGRGEAYINADTNNPDILNAIKPYRKK